LGQQGSGKDKELRRLTAGDVVDDDAIADLEVLAARADLGHDSGCGLMEFHRKRVEVKIFACYQ
jgi:hypothetical protein